jgi:hypothetical protein
VEGRNMPDHCPCCEKRIQELERRIAALEFRQPIVINPAPIYPIYPNPWPQPVYPLWWGNPVCESNTLISKGDSHAT